MPAVVLVGGAGRQDRDETQYGVSIFGELAGRLAENGYLVIRFDKRGLGQSGGRPEHAGLNEYADDVVSIVDWLKRRKDVDSNRIVVVTHGEGSAVGMLAAGKKKDIKGLAMLAAPGLPGREVVLEQQKQTLTRRGERTAGTGGEDPAADAHHQCRHQRARARRSAGRLAQAGEHAAVQELADVRPGGDDEESEPAGADRSRVRSTWKRRHRTRIGWRRWRPRARFRRHIPRK